MKHAMWSLGTWEHQRLSRKGGIKGITARAAAKLIINKSPGSTESNSVHGRVVSDNALVHANSAILGGSR